MRRRRCAEEASDGERQLGVDGDVESLRRWVFCARYGVGEHGNVAGTYIGEREGENRLQFGDKFPNSGEIRFEIESLISIQNQLGFLGKKGEERGKEVRRKSGRL